MSANFYAHIAHTLRTQPAETLLTWPAEAASAAGVARYSGAEIAAAVAAMRQRLTAAGVRPGQRVLLLTPVSFGLVASLLGIMAHGAMAVLPPAGASAGQLWQLARRGAVAAVLPRAPRLGLKLLARLLQLRLVTVPAVLGEQVLPTAAEDAAPPQAVPPDQPALISHTSGSTGRPKQIVRTHGVLSAQHAVLKAILPPWPGQQDFPLFPNVLLHNLAAGAASILPAVPWGNFTDFHPPLIAGQLRDFGIQTLTGNAFYFQKLLPELQAQPGGFPLVRAVGVGGSPVPEWLGQELQKVFPNATVYIIYGSSEAEPIAVRPLAGPPENPALGYCVGPVHPSLEMQLEVVGEIELANAVRRPVGEIRVRGPHVASAAPGGWLRTGDFGYLAANGQLYLTGRQGNETLHGGAQHYQIEHVIQHLPGVQRVAARPVAAGFAVYVQGSATEAAVRAALAAHWPAELCVEVHFRAELPVDARHHSKIRYTEVR